MSKTTGKAILDHQHVASCDTFRASDIANWLDLEITHVQTSIRELCREGKLVRLEDGPLGGSKYRRRTDNIFACWKRPSMGASDTSPSAEWCRGDIR